MSQPALALLLCLGALVLEASASASEDSTFFKPLTCDQEPYHRQTCGGEAEKFYPNQCLQKKCCYMNNTCYHHTIDGAVQRRNAGILGGTTVVLIIFCACLFYGCKFREFQKKERMSEGPTSEGNIDDYLVKLLDDESMAESEPQEGPASVQEESWPERRGSKQVGWSPEPVELEELRMQRQWTPEPSLEPSPGPSPEPPPLTSEPPPPATAAPPPATDVPPPATDVPPPATAAPPPADAPPPPPADAPPPVAEAPPPPP